MAKQADVAIGILIAKDKALNAEGIITLVGGFWGSVNREDGSLEAMQGVALKYQDEFNALLKKINTDLLALGMAASGKAGD